MKKMIILPVTLLFCAALSAQSTKSLKTTIELKIVGEGGANGGSVTWHPGQKKYYAAIAGNTAFPFAVYNEKGDRLSTGEQQTMFDIRGMWYNSKTKTIQVNGYKDFGWAEYKLDDNGIPQEISPLQEGKHQPSDQCSGSYDPKENAVYFMTEEGELEKYDYETASFIKAVNLRLGKTKKNNDNETSNSDVIENYNSTTAVFTGIKNAEIGLLNTLSREIELYSLSDGFLSRRLKLPDSAPVNGWLNFAYSNNHFWLFDKENRVWRGYKQ